MRWEYDGIPERRASQLEMWMRQAVGLLANLGLWAAPACLGDYFRFEKIRETGGGRCFRCAQTGR
jgi:hypothetical protein